jgi:GcrA cell cycle regulator
MLSVAFDLYYSTASLHFTDVLAIYLAALRGEFGVSDRRNWTQAELANIRQALSLSTTAAIAKQYSTNAKTLRSALRRHGVSIRHTRKGDRPRKSLAGVRVQRSDSGVAAIYGAEALAVLPDRACHWPIGDPGEPGFQFCGAHVSSLGPYCAEHRAKAYLPAQP